jgi:hypothetical protein
VCAVRRGCPEHPKNQVTKMISLSNNYCSSLAKLLELRQETEAQSFVQALKNSKITFQGHFVTWNRHNVGAPNE